MKTPISIGLDVGEPGGDKSMMAVRKGDTIIYLDEMSNFDWPKWYRQPRVWWTFKKITFLYIGKANWRGRFKYWYYKKRGWVIANQFYWRRSK